MTRRSFGFTAITVVLGLLGATPAAAATSSMGTVHLLGLVSTGQAASGGNLSFHGGVAGTGVETSPAVYLIYWGWTSDPTGAGHYLGRFMAGIGGSQWANSTTQYCQSVPVGTTDCSTSPGAVYAGNPAKVLKGYWIDTTNFLPGHPSQSQLGAEADRAAVHFGNLTATSNRTTQYVIATPHSHNSLGFGVTYCAYHGYLTTAHGNIAFTNLPFIPDAGASCGQNFVNAGAAGTLDGISIVEGHEYAETVTDQFPSAGWIDSGGAENGDKCAWIQTGQGASADITLSTGTFAVQSLWSNAFNSGAGGCVI